MSIKLFPIVCRLLLDTAIVLLLVVLAFAFAYSVKVFLFPNAWWMDALWLWIGLIPCLYYMRYRGVGEFNWLDTLIFAPIPLISTVISFLVSPHVTVIVFVALLPICLRLRAFLNEYEYVECFADPQTSERPS